MNIFIAGATGFVGRHLIKALKEKGHKVRCLVRSEAKKIELQKQGFEAAVGDISEAASLRGLTAGCDMVVHLVGIIEEKDGSTFTNVHIEGTANLIFEAKKSGVKHFFYQSALGASLTSSSEYSKTKAEAEELLKNSGIPFTIFRPSLIVGNGDKFTESLKGLIELGPVVPVPGDGNVRFQPIYIQDWIACFFGITGNPESFGKTFEFGGPEHLSFNEILIDLMDAAYIRKPLIHLPLNFLKLAIPFASLGQRFGGLIGKNIPAFNNEQLYLLTHENICELDSIEKLFGYKPISFQEALRKFIKK